MTCLDDIISEAKCCAGNLGHRISRTVSFGNEDEILSFDFMRLMMYIRTLERNKTTFITERKVVYETPEKVPLHSLQRNKKTLYLNQKPEPRVIYTKIEITPCLTDSEIRSIIEQIRLLCSNCNCECN